MESNPDPGWRVAVAMLLLFVVTILGTLYWVAQDHGLR